MAIDLLVVGRKIRGRKITLQAFFCPQFFCHYYNWQVNFHKVDVTLRVSQAAKRAPDIHHSESDGYFNRKVITIGLVPCRSQNRR